jgi:hypothetical protein
MKIGPARLILPMLNEIRNMDMQLLRAGIMGIADWYLFRILMLLFFVASIVFSLAFLAYKHWKQLKSLHEYPLNQWEIRDHRNKSWTRIIAFAGTGLAVFFGAMFIVLSIPQNRPVGSVDPKLVTRYEAIAHSLDEAARAQRRNLEAQQRLWQDVQSSRHIQAATPWPRVVAALVILSFVVGILYRFGRGMTRGGRLVLTLLGLLSAVAIGRDLNVFGDLNFGEKAEIDSLIHIEMGKEAGGEQEITLVTAHRPDSIPCDRSWTVERFRIGQDRYLEKDSLLTASGLQRGPIGRQLTEAVGGVLQKIAREQPHPPDILLLGSTDLIQYRAGKGTNLDLAKRRADIVKEILKRDGRYAGKISVLNDRVLTGLVRVTFGLEERPLGRAVLVCTVAQDAAGSIVRLTRTEAGGGSPGQFDLGLFVGFLIGSTLSVALVFALRKASKDKGDVPGKPQGPPEPKEPEGPQ